MPRWREDKLRPTQPYFVLDTQEFFQEVYLQQGISHFYAFATAEPLTLRVVPDGCIDLFFEYTDAGMRAWATGTVLGFEQTHHVDAGEVFGVRFMPGVQPALLTVKHKDLVGGQRRALQEVLALPALMPLMAEQTDFYQRIRVFLQAYTPVWRRTGAKEPTAKQELVWSVKRMVYESDGKVRVSELAEGTGYSERYINRVFIEEMGFSPKTFCKILQFQRALLFLNYGAPGKMTDAATALGYYDQPQFIRDFKAYCGVTPLQYLKMNRDRKYTNLINETDFTHEG